MYTVTFSLRFWYNTNTIEQAGTTLHTATGFFLGGFTLTVCKQIPFGYDSVSYNQLLK